jgi:serine protease AprX
MQLPFIDDLNIYAAPIPTPQRVRTKPHLTGKGVTIAFLDSGFFQHPDFADRVVAYADATGERVIERKQFKSLHPTSWHGTMTVGVCAGDGSLSNGLFKGIATDAKLVLIKTGQPNTFRIKEADIARALVWILENYLRFDIRIVNISLGGDTPCKGKLTPLDRLVEEATALGLVVICASGNSATRKIVPPASAPSAITVGGLNDHNSSNKRKWEMYRSSYGFGCGGAMKPELIAPAQWIAAPMLPGSKTFHDAQFWWKLERANDDELKHILKTREAKQRISAEVLPKPLSDIRRAVRERINNEKFVHVCYQHVDGTSFAAPIVSSVVAQMLEVNPLLTPAQIKKILRDTADPIEDAPLERQGAGVIHAAKAVDAAVRLKRKVGKHRQRG